MSNLLPSPSSRPLEQLKVAELRDELRKRGLSLKGIKKDLFERLEEAIKKDEQAGMPVGEPGVSGESQQKGVHGTVEEEGVCGTAQQEEMADFEGEGEVLNKIDDEATTVSHDANASYMNQAGVASQDTGFILKEASAPSPVIELSTHASASDSDPALMEPPEDMEKQKDADVINNESNNVVPFVDNPASVNVGTVLESGNVACGNDDMVSEPGNVASGNDVIVSEVSYVDSGNDGIVSEYSYAPSGNEILVPESAINENVVIAEESDHTANVNDIVSEVVIPSTGKDDDANMSVSDNVASVTDVSVSAFDNAVSGHDYIVQDVEVIEKTILTGVNVVPEEPAEDQESLSPKPEVSEVPSENPPLTAIKEVELPVANEVLLSLMQTSDIRSLELPQDIVMSEAYDVGNSDLKTEELGMSLDTIPTAALQDVCLPSADVKTEDLGRSDIDERDRIVGLGKSEDVKVEPLEKETRSERRRVSVDKVKLEQPDSKEELPKPERSFDRSRPKEVDYEKSRHDYARAHKYVEEKSRTEGRAGRVFREEWRKDTKDSDSKPAEDDSHIRSSQKRKDDDRDVKQQEPSKRMRRWNSGNQLVVETSKPLTTGTVKEIMSPEIKEGSSVVAPKLTPKTLAMPRSIPPTTKAGSEANGNKRAVPPPTRAPTTSLKVERFVRPFTLKAVKDMLSEFGQCVDFWMDQIKTHCYVMYSTVDEAVAARNALYDKQWPPSFGNLLVADFVDANEVKIRSEGLLEKAHSTPATTPRGIPNPSSALAVHSLAPSQGYPDTLPPAPPLRERQLLQLPKNDPEPPIPTLEDLFKKTKAKPHIYYLPLTDEQVAEKLAAAKNKEQHLKIKPSGRV